MRKALKNAFIPHEGNNHRPHALRPKAIAAVCATVIVVQVVFSFGAASWFMRSKMFGIIEVNTLTDGTNAARTADNLPTLTENPLLQVAAQEKANDMVAKGYFAHTSPSGTTPWYWFGSVGYNFIYAGENLAVNFSDSRDVTQAWLNSPEHRANIMDTNYTQIGIATARGTYNGQPATYVVELFGAPANVAPLAVGNPIVPTARAAITNPAPVKSPTGVKTSAPVTSKPKPAVVAINGAPAASETNAVQAAPVAPVAAQTVASTGTVPPQGATTPGPAETNIVQRAFANPTRTLDSFYLFVLAFFAFALGLNIFIKIRVQHPDLILGGLVVVSLVGIFIITNQQTVLRTIIK